MTKGKTRKHRKHRKHRKRTKRRKAKFKVEKCSPKTNGDDLDFTCYSKDALHKLKTHWNARHPDVRIHSNDVKDIWNELKKNMRKTCYTESC